MNELVSADSTMLENSTSSSATVAACCCQKPSSSAPVRRGSTMNSGNKGCCRPPNRCHTVPIITVPRSCEASAEICSLSWDARMARELSASCASAIAASDQTTGPMSTCASPKYQEITASAAASTVESVQVLSNIAL